MSETISKASVCEILADIYPTDGEKVVAVKEVDKAYEAIQQLPSTQPERMRFVQQAVNMIMHTAKSDSIKDKSFRNAARLIQNAIDGEPQDFEPIPDEPQRKKGEWTDDNACPFCGFQPWYERDIHTLSYCPNCGADMRGGMKE